ncbi:MAG: prolipoprotein diacylglyceryl transferase [Prevotellaceae bacterium]|jgi:prolipoprotein diacylglyceryl transferase|nr:prolipoprotein diacylglyceryl transferase [Prevotellaceae bacterium]
MLNFITWNVNPEIFHFGFLSVRWYGLLWALAIFSAYWVVTAIFKHEKRPEGWNDKLFIYGAVSLIIGARVGHCLFYGADGDFWHYYKNPFEMLKIWEGGLSSHGGAIGLLTGMWLFTRKVTHKTFLYAMDRLVIGVAIGGALIRLGNLMNSEIYGGVTDLPWGFIFMRDHQTLPAHPTQIYEMLYCLVTFAITMLMYWKSKSYRREGLIFGVFLICIFGTRFMLEFIKNLQEPFEANMPLNMGQILSLPLIIWGIYLIINAFIKKPELADFEIAKNPTTKDTKKPQKSQK